MDKPSLSNFLNQVPEMTLCGLFVYSLTDAKHEYLNPAFTALTGWNLTDLQAMSFEQVLGLFHPDQVDQVEQHLQEIGKAPIGQAMEIVYQFQHKNGKWIWCKSRNIHVEFDVHGGPGKILGSFIDISGERALADQLSQSQERLSLAAEAGKIGIWDWDLNGGVSTNDRRVHEQFDMDWGGTDDAEIWFSRIHPDDAPAVRAAVAAAVEDHANYDVRYRVCWRDGSIHHLMAKGTVIRNADGQPVRLLGMNIDMTEQVELQQRMEQRQKMEAIGQLAGGIAHDFNNQLMAVLGNAELLKHHLPDSKLSHFIDAIIKATERSTDLTRQLLNYARQGVTKHTRFDFNNIIKEVVDILQHSIDKRINIKFDLADTAGKIVGDESNLQSALLNLALNARDAMPDGGTLTFSTAVSYVGDAPAGRSLGELKPGRYFCVSVTDTGTGISESQLARIREPFYTTKGVGAGTGLGLSAADGIIQRHGGYLDIQSVVGVGTKMTMHLPYPVVDDSADQVVQEVAASDNSWRILVIDDEPMAIDVLKTVLSEDGHFVHCENNPIVGIDYYESHWREIDVTLLDMTMPQLDGSTLFRRLRNINKEVPLLIISGHSPEGAVDTLLKDGNAAFLQKPFSIAKIRSAIRELLR